MPSMKNPHSPLAAFLACALGQSALRRRYLVGAVVVFAALLFVWLRARRRDAEPANA